MGGNCDSTTVYLKAEVCRYICHKITALVSGMSNTNSWKKKKKMCSHTCLQKPDLNLTIMQKYYQHFQGLAWIRKPIEHVHTVTLYITVMNQSYTSIYTSCQFLGDHQWHHSSAHPQFKTATIILVCPPCHLLPLLPYLHQNYPKISLLKFIKSCQCTLVLHL